jgi:hypothetical protein
MISGLTAPRLLERNCLSYRVGGGPGSDGVKPLPCPGRGLHCDLSPVIFEQ